MNPFMYLPYKSPASELQEEWEKIRDEKLYKRRGLSNEEYKMIKEKKLNIESLENVLIDDNRVIS
jgi:hypothetical protein